MNKNKKGSLIPELLISMILVVVTSAVIFFLVQQGIIQVKAENSQESILNAEFLPYGREGSVVIKDFSFCQDVGSNYNCLGPKETFTFGDKIYFRFVVESSTYNGNIMLVENYRIKDSSGNILLDVEDKSSYDFEIQSSEKNEQIAFKDYFTVGQDSVPGEYVLDLLVENPLLNKKTTLTKTFQVE